MENPKKLPECKNFPWKQNSITPCQRFGLDVSKLNIEHLFKFREYRRLYNIVATDQTPSEYQFRPNLIKQLYFLLQITPFIEEQLQLYFLSSIEEWYNSNDHKKINLSRNLKGMLSNVLMSRSKKKIVRPKSGIEWDKNINCFLRPYTAKIRRNQNQRLSNGNRPQSSKYGVKQTCADTNAFTQTLTNNDLAGDNFQYQQDLEDRYNDLCDIQQQWERSRDFIHKHRTIHPEEQPTYQKLMKIILRNGNDQEDQYKGSRTNYNSRILKNSASHPTKVGLKKRDIYSATIKRQNTRIVAHQQIIEQRKQSGDANLVSNKKADNDIGHRQTQKLSNQEENIQDNESENRQQNMETQFSEAQFSMRDKKLFTKDKRSKNLQLKDRNSIQKSSKNKLYSRVNGLKIVRPFTSAQTHIIHKLDHYHQLENNKKVICNNEDEQFKQKSINFIRNKGISRKQLARRTQSKRIYHKISDCKNDKNKQLLQKGVPQIKNFQFDFRQSEKRISNTKSQIKLINNQTKQANYYSIKKFFKDKKNNILQKEVEKLKKIYEVANQQDKNKVFEGQNIKNHNQMPINSKTAKLNTDYRFDPTHSLNVERYNQQILEEVQKIKDKMATTYKYTNDNNNWDPNNIGVTTDALLKALYVETNYNLPVSDILVMHTDTAQKLELIQDSQKQNKLNMFDKGYLMMAKGEKRKPKKKKKLNSRKMTKSLRR